MTEATKSEAPKKTRVSTQLDNLKAQMEMERDQVLRATTPLYREREKLVGRIQPLEDQLRELDAKIKEAEKPLYDVGNGLAQLARASGARVISNGEEVVAPASTEETPHVAKH
jgi:chromosome segregation ATPase